MSTKPEEKLLKTLDQWEASQKNLFVGTPTALGRPLSIEHYENWLKSGKGATMEYLQSSLPLKKNPHEAFPGMCSIIPIAHNYLIDESDTDEIRNQTPLSHLRTAHYSKGKDYHLWFREKLRRLQKELESVFPEHSFLSFTDSVPILERDFARQSGLGWVGKNTCLIHPKRGSFFFIGEILTSLPVSFEQDLMRNFCGTCNACVEACPTDALDEKGLDANKCISFWTIEAKKPPPIEFRSKISDWFFGCDICQTVCPWNIKWHGKKSNFENSTSSANSSLVEELRWVLTSSNRELQKALAETALMRAGGRGLKRNALIVIGNKKISELKPEVEKFLDHQRLGELAHWAISSLSS